MRWRRDFSDEIGAAVVGAQMAVFPDEWKPHALSSSLTFNQVGQVRIAGAKCFHLRVFGEKLLSEHSSPSNDSRSMSREQIMFSNPSE